MVVVVMMIMVLSMLVLVMTVLRFKGMSITHPSRLKNPKVLALPSLNTTTMIIITNN